MSDRLSITFSALADPTRRAILARLAHGQATVNELAEPFAMSLPAVSKHLKVLERAGLIVRGREAQWRPCKLAPEPLKDANDWIAQYRAFWEQRFDRLEAYLQTMQQQPDPQPSGDREAEERRPEPAEPPGTQSESPQSPTPKMKESKHGRSHRPR